MKKKEITICGKPVTLGYCYATEIGYKLLSDHDIADFAKEVAECLTVEPPSMPDTLNVIHAILASVNAYYESKGEESPIKDTDLMYDASPTEIGTALGTIISLRAEFYHLPTDEPTDKPKDDDTEKKD